jgi:hypothetical protein
VDSVELSMRRSQMGRGAGAMVRGGPRPIVDEGVGYWIALSGVPSPDVNTSLVSSGGTGVVARVLEQVTGAGVPVRGAPRPLAAGRRNAVHGLGS